MKNLILLLTMIVTLNLSAQSSDVVSSKIQDKKLSEQDFKAAKALYVKMVASELFIKSRNHSLILVQKMKRVLLPEQEASLAKYLETHLADTNFKSVDEAVSLINEGLEIEKKLVTENIELYTLISKASSEQLMEILQPEFEYKRKQFGM